MHPLWVDEAESAINALTILEHGYPTDTYLGIPLYENTLVQPWPQSHEYEFRDLSYSDRHFAVYHGWLPLYSMALSFTIYGIAPDTRDGTHAIRHDLGAQQLRTTAARAPAIVFAAAFLIAVFLGATMLYGRDAGWTALILGSIYPWHMYLSRQARYYSAQILLTTVCCLLAWRMTRKGSWRDFIWSGIAFALLFHTHLLGFATAVAAVVLASPFIVRNHEHSGLKLSVFGGVIAAATVPWIVITGFNTQLGRIPRAWTLLRFPADLLQYPPFKLKYVVVGALFAAAITSCTIWGSPHVSLRAKLSLKQAVPAVMFLALWSICGYSAVILFMPSVSFAAERLNLSYWGPTLLLASIVCAAAARIIASGRSVACGPALALLSFWSTGHLREISRDYSDRSWSDNAQVIDHIRTAVRNENTKLYASPNDHLIWMFYMGLPVQSIAPVRKQFLNEYAGDIVYIDSPICVSNDILRPERIKAAALRHGCLLSTQSAADWALLLRSRDYRESMLKIVGGERAAPLEPVPEFGEKLLDGYRQYARAALRGSDLEVMTRGFDVQTWSDWRSVLMYRFANVSSRSGRNANYAERLRGAAAVILIPSDTVIYYSRWHAIGDEAGIAFSFATSNSPLRQPERVFSQQMVSPGCSPADPPLETVNVAVPRHRPLQP